MYKQTFPIKVSRMASLLELKSESGNTFQELLERDEMPFFVEERPARKFDRLNFRTRTEDEFQVHSCTKEYFANVILSSSVIGILSQNNILVFDWCPYEPLRSNVELILGEDHNTHFFAEKCFYGVHAKTVETEKW